MTNAVSLLGMFTPAQSARDAKANDDNALASFAGMLAGANQATAKLIVPTPQADGSPDGDVLENAEEGDTAGNATPSDDSSDARAVAATPATDGASTATTISITNPNAVNSSIAALNPALQERLARVITRMREETGRDVQVTETYRSQSRQNALFAQGRQTDGPVVTWTQHSKHTQGRAVDVVLDGGRASADAYTALQRIANEEGLRTLGAKDPGHLELPAKSAATSQALNDVISVPDAPADASGPRQVAIARLANIAQVASVARVATVAGPSTTRAARTSAANAGVHSGAGKHAKQQMAVQQVSAATTDRVQVADGDVALPEQTTFVQDNTAFAQADGAADMPLAPQNDGFVKNAVATPDISIADATGAISDEDSPKGLKISNLDRLSDAVNATRIGRLAPRAQAAGAATEQPRATQAAIKTQNGANASAQASTPSIGRSPNNSQSFNSDRQSSDRNANGYSAMNLRSEPTVQFSVADVSSEMTSNAPQRAERIMAAQDAPARPLSQIVMSVDNGNGTSDRIHVALRGSNVSATIDAADHHAANALRAHSDELVRSLTRDGVEVESVHVRSAATTSAANQVATVDSSQKSQDSSNNSRFNRDAQWDQQRSQQRSNNERRQHQRNQRGDKES